jgi:hypothetical protein
VITVYLCPTCGVRLGFSEVMRLSPVVVSDYGHMVGGELHYVDAWPEELGKYNPSPWALEILERRQADIRHTEMLAEILKVGR